MLKLTLAIIATAFTAAPVKAQTVVTETPRTVIESTSSTTTTRLSNGGTSTRTTSRERAISSRSVQTRSSSATFNRGSGFGNCTAAGCVRRTGPYVSLGGGSYRDVERGTLRRDTSNIRSNSVTSPFAQQQNTTVFRNTGTQRAAANVNRSANRTLNNPAPTFNPYPFRR